MSRFQKIFLVVTFFVIFFVNLELILFRLIDRLDVNISPCERSWNCPDYGYPPPDFVSIKLLNFPYPNFYSPEKISGGLSREGIWSTFYPSFWSIHSLIFDLILWVGLNLILFLVLKLKRRK